MSSSATTFKFDEKTSDLIEELKKHYGATSKAEVIRKSLGLLELARKAEDEEAQLIVRGKEKNGEEYEQQILIK